jgi:hypothetical protein
LVRVVLGAAVSIAEALSAWCSTYLIALALH